MLRALLSLLLFTLLPTYASTQQYTAEIILFETEGASENSSNHHNNTLAYKQVDVLTPYYNPEAFYLSSHIENDFMQFATGISDSHEHIAKIILQPYPKPFTTWENWARSPTHAVNTDSHLLLNNIAQRLSSTAKNHVLLHIGWDFVLNDSNSATFNINSNLLNILPYKTKPYSLINGYIHLQKNVFFDLDSRFDLKSGNHQQYTFSASERLKEKQMYFIDKAPYGILMVVQSIAPEKTSKTV